jgi:hypothetical protein
MEPISLTAGAIATLVLTKAFEKAGEELGGKVLEQGAKLLALLRRKAPDTASAIEQAQQYPLDIGQAHLISAVETAAKSDPEIAEMIQAISSELKQRLSPVVVRQVMVSGVMTEGNLKAGNLTQKNKQSGFVEQVMATDIRATNVEFGDLTQES